MSVKITMPQKEFFHICLTPTWVLGFQECPVGKYLFKVTNKGSMKTFIDVVLIVLLLSLKPHSTRGLSDKKNETQI